MHFPKSGLLIAIALTAVLGSFRAFSDFVKHEPLAPDSYAIKKNYYLESPDVGVVEFEVDENFKPLTPPETDEPELEPESLVSPVPSPIPSALPVAAETPLITQAIGNYNRGKLQNASRLEIEGPGYIKVFQEREQISEGRTWGTNALISLIQKTGQEFSKQFPGRERLQVADLSRRAGGLTTGHASHQNGLDVDLVYLRKDRKEQASVSIPGQTSFLESFIKQGSVTYRSYNDKRGRKRTKKIVTYTPSDNFDVEANFHLLLTLQKSGDVKAVFADSVLIREMYRYAENAQLSEVPEVRAILGKLSHVRSHDDHLHVRILCPPTDTACVSETAPRAKRRKSSARRSGVKRPAKKSAAVRAPASAPENFREFCTSSSRNVNVCLESALQYRCTNYGRFSLLDGARIRRCNQAVTRMVKIMDIVQVPISRDEKNPDDPVESSGLLLKQVLFKKNLRTTFESSQTASVFDEALRSLQDSARFNRPHDLWSSVLDSYHGSRASALKFIAEAVQDVSLGIWHLTYLGRRYDVEKRSELDTGVKNLEGAAHFIEMYRLNLEAKIPFSAYPPLGGVEKSLDPYLHHFYLPAYLAAELKRGGSTEEAAFFAAFLLNTGYEFVKLEAKLPGKNRWPFRDPAPFHSAREELQLRKIYTGYVGALWGIGQERRVKPYTEFSRELAAHPYEAMRGYFHLSLK